MTRTQALLAAAVTMLAFLSFIVGRSLAPEGDGAAALDLDAAAYRPASTTPGLSKGGFTGFTETAAEGRTVVSGRVVSVAADSITVESSGGQQSTLRLLGQGQPRRLQPGTRQDIRQGATVIVRRDPSSSDVAAAILVISN
jgi:hypothetical protein